MKSKIFVILTMFLCSIFNFAKPKVGITLLPYYSYVKNVVRDKMDVVPVIPANVDVHSYHPTTDDMKKLTNLDYIVINGIGHDEFVKPMINAARKNNKKLKVINADAQTSVMNVAGQKRGRARNPHTFISITQSIQQINYIAKRLGELDPKNKAFYASNARQYTNKLRNIKIQELKKVRGLNLSNIKVATTHAGYDYLLNEFGLTVSLVIEPQHAQAPNASDLKYAIDKIKRNKIAVLFDEEGGNPRNAITLHKATGIKIAHLSHMTRGNYTADAFERFIRHDLSNVATTLKSLAKGK